MTLADLTEPNAVLKAIEEADALGRQSFLDKYGFSPSRGYLLRHDGRLYDSKAIIGAAHGYQHPERGPLKSTDFSGGEQTVQRKLEQLGFAVEARTAKETVDLASLNEGLEAALLQYPPARQTPFTGTHPINAVFHSLTQTLQSSNCIKEFPTLRVRFSTGQGNWARVPWIAILDDRITTTTQSGFYCVFLFREDGSGVYLTLAQGVTEPQRRLGATAGKAELRANAQTIRASLGALTDAGFSLSDGIDLHTGPGLGSDYEASAIAYRLYERDNVPEDEQLVSDLGALINSYEQIVSEATVIAEGDVTPTELLRAFSTSLKSAGLDYGTRHDRICATFLASILSKPFVLLTGLTGSGKTQIALKFGEWLGEARRLVVAVRPDWTGPESLFGYENALSVPDADGRLAWFVPPALEFMLRAVHHQDEPHLLVLDEMNLAHVERYFADFLSGMESGEPTLPNLVKEGAYWRVSASDPQPVPIPRNLWVVGTVNVDETTYAFSPKVLDRAQTIEFRVATEDLNPAGRRPTVVEAAPAKYLATLLGISREQSAQTTAVGSDGALLVESLKTLHKLLAARDLEFGHRTLTEAIRLWSTLNALGGSNWLQALDLIILQMILPRIHGSRPRVETVLIDLEGYCTNVGSSGADTTSNPALPFSISKVRRMLRIVRANQFVSFTE
jgi:5-methylcytosine-specific restriction protein B